MGDLGRPATPPFLGGPPKSYAPGLLKSYKEEEREKRNKENKEEEEKKEEQENKAQRGQ